MSIEKVLTALKTLESKSGLSLSIDIEASGNGNVVSWDLQGPKVIIEFESIDDFYEKAISYSS